MNLWLRMRRMHIMAREGVKFAIVGWIGLILDLFIFNALVFDGSGDGPLHDRPLIARTIAVIAATVLTYTGHRMWTFRHRARMGVAREYALFFVLNGIGLGISLACLWVAHDPLGLTGPLAYNITNLVGVALGSLFRFWSYRTWVFPAPMEHREVKSSVAGGEREPLVAHAHHARRLSRDGSA